LSIEGDVGGRVVCLNDVPIGASPCQVYEWQMKEALPEYAGPKSTLVNLDSDSNRGVIVKVYGRTPMGPPNFTHVIGYARLWVKAHPGDEDTVYTAYGTGHRVKSQPYHNFPKVGVRLKLPAR
jgi:hypothetical protein